MSTRCRECSLRYGLAQQIFFNSFLTCQREVTTPDRLLCYRVESAGSPAHM